MFQEKEKTKPKTNVSLINVQSSLNRRLHELQTSPIRRKVWATFEPFTLCSAARNLGLLLLAARSFASALRLVVRILTEK